MSNKQKIGVCGIACFKCHKFVKKECPGCQINEFCAMPKCAQNKKVDLCFECKEFPCELHYSAGPFNKEILDFHKGK